jgi:hypothetical protein
MVEEYMTHFIGSEVKINDLGWSGDEKNCLAGTISDNARLHTLNRINYFRRLAKLPTEVSFDETLTPMCQEAALIMHSNNQLSHAPPPDWSCYTEEGKLAASKSNLALGAHTTNAIALYMIDPGENNGPVGHRRWILYSRASSFGMGSTSRAQSLYVIHKKAAAPEDLTFIAYPGEGFFPAPLLPERWSLSVPGGNFEAADVLMLAEDGTQIKVDVLPYKGGFGDNTLVWEPEPGLIEKFNPIDQKYKITVSNIMTKGRATSIGYEVIIAQTVHPPSCLEGLDWSESDCGCVEKQTTSTKLPATSGYVLEVSPSPVSQNLHIETNLGIAEPSVLKILNYAGELMEQSQLSGRMTVDVSRYPTGFYLVIVESATDVLTKKVAVFH